MLPNNGEPAVILWCASVSALSHSIRQSAKKNYKRSELFKAQLSKKKPGSNALHSITLAPAKPLGLALTLALAHVTWPRSRPRRITLAPAKPLGLALTLALAQDTCGLGNVKQAF